MIPIFDTHQHLIVPPLAPYGWTDDIAALKNKTFDLSDYRRASENLGINGTIWMEASPDDWRAEAPIALQTAAREPTMMGVVANCRPEDDEFEAYLDGIDHPKLVGLRRICHVEPDELSTRPRFIENVRRLGPLNLTFDLCFLARGLPLAARLAQDCPNVAFVLDHCGVPDIAGGNLEEWRRDLAQIARLPNVNCKISGIVAYCKPGEATLQTLRPVVEHCLQCFGWKRVVWGSDWPVCNQRATLSQWVEIARAVVAGASPSQQRQFWSENARRIYRLAEAN